MRLSGLLARHRTGSTRAIATLVLVWAVLAAFGARIVPAMPMADTNATILVQEHAAEVRDRLYDRQAFANEVGVDPFRDVPGDQLLTGLRGKNVVIAFVESYGRDAVTDAEFASIPRMLDERADRLATAGFAPAAASSPHRRSAVRAGWHTPRCSPACGWTTTSATGTCSPPIGSPSVTRSGAPPGVRSG